MARFYVDWSSHNQKVDRVVGKKEKRFSRQNVILHFLSSAVVW